MNRKLSVAGSLAIVVIVAAAMWIVWEGGEAIDKSLLLPKREKAYYFLTKYYGCESARSVDVSEISRLDFNRVWANLSGDSVFVCVGDSKEAPQAVVYERPLPYSGPFRSWKPLAWDMRRPATVPAVYAETERSWLATGLAWIFLCGLGTSVLAYIWKPARIEGSATKKELI